MIEILRAVTKDQIEKISKLAKTIWTEYYTPIIGASQVEYMLKTIQSYDAIIKQIDSDELSYFLIYFGKTAAGYFAINVKNDEIFLSKLYVEKQYRGKRLASRAIGFVKNIAVENCLKKITLTINKTNNKSMDIYKNIGFTVKKEAVADIGNGFVMDDYVLELAIS